MTSPDLPTNAPSDDQLDELLQSVEWPQPDAAAVERLQSVWDDAVTQPAVKAHSAPPHSAGRRLLQTAAIAAAIVLAWLAGRWSVTSNDQQSIAESELVPAGRHDDIPLSPTPKNGIAVTPDDMNQPGPERVPEKVADANDTQSPSAVMEPIPESGRPRRRSKSRSQLLRENVDTVLACIQDQSDVDDACVEPLLKWRRESEYLLWQIVQNATGQRRLAAITAIGFVGSDESIPGLVQTLNDQELRAASLDALLRCSDEESLAIFVRQQHDRDIAAMFAEELVRRPARQSQPVYLQLVLMPESRNVALTVADDLSAEALDLTVAALDNPVVRERIAAAATLGARSDDATLNRIIGLIRQHPTRWEPVAALMWNGSEQAMAVLSRLQSNPNTFAVLQTATVQLQSFGPAK